MSSQEQPAEVSTDNGVVKSNEEMLDGKIEQSVVKDSTVEKSVGEGETQGTGSSVPPQNEPQLLSPIIEEPAIDITTVPKVIWKVEYRQRVDNTLLYSRDVTDSTHEVTKKQQTSHAGPVFEVIDVNYTAETGDTIKSAESKNKKDLAPSFTFAGKQFMRIHSPSVINALGSIVNYYPSHNIMGNPVDIDEPYSILVHHWEEIEAFRERFSPEVLEKDGDVKDCLLKDTHEHLGYVLRFLEDRFKDRLRLEKNLWTQPIPKVSFDMLWLLLKPGTDVYCDIDHTESRDPFVVSEVMIMQTNKTISEYVVHVWHLGGDSYFICPQYRTVVIRRFDGEKDITKLDVFPCEYQADHNERREILIKEGKLLLQLRRKKCMYFDGESNTFPRRRYKGYVMTDIDQYGADIGDSIKAPRLNWPIIVDGKPSGMPYCLCKRCMAMDKEVKKPAKFEGYMSIHPENMDDVTDHQYFICARETFAFVFHIREWKLLFLSGFQEPKWDRGLIDTLVLKPHYKSVIQNLSENFMQQNAPARTKTHNSPSSAEEAKGSQSWSADFIESKGRGLIFLLHGKPGVGKTYTAECIAEYVHRPLLPITCADIGVRPSDVEKKLVRWFKIARTWDAVMLLDEADIYMEYRQIHDLTRNNLVASFLRAMEYYEGILFLTTNRVGTFDEAFLSRINLAIYYPDFQDDDREKIWHNYFDKLERDAGDRFYVPEGTKEYATESDAVRDLKWNGREIRNAFQVAVSLAEAEGAKDKKGRFTVKRDHIKATVELSKEFKSYMVSVHKKNESQRAQLMGYRYDAFNNPSAPSKEFF